MRDGLELLVNDRTVHLTRAVEDLRLEITERKKAEAQISEQARMLELAPDAIIARDLEDRIRFWNKHAERIYGWTASEVMGKKVEEVLHKDVFYAAKYQEARKTVLQTGDWEGELSTRTKAGREVIVAAHLTLVRDEQGNPKSVLGVSTDVTYEKKLEAHSCVRNAWKVSAPWPAALAMISTMS